MEHECDFIMRARREDMVLGADSIKLYAFEKRGRDYSVARFLQLEPAPKNRPFDPFISIDRRTAQQLMDDFWDCGLRPSEGTGSAGAMAATQKHLQDMTTIAFHALKIRSG